MHETLKIILYYFAALVGFLIFILGATLFPGSPSALPLKLTWIDYLHPSISIPSVILVITAYFLKKGIKEKFLAHYIAGTLAVILTLAAFFVAVTVVDGNHGNPPWSSISILPLHLFFAIIFIVPIVVVHGAMGMSMLLFGRKAGRVSIHKRLANWVLIIYLIQGTFGLIVLFSLHAAFAHL